MKKFSDLEEIEIICDAHDINDRLYSLEDSYHQSRWLERILLAVVGNLKVGDEKWRKEFFALIDHIPRQHFIEEIEEPIQKT